MNEPSPLAAILRQDLSLLDAEPGPGGERAWLLHDPLSGRYFRIGQTQIEILNHIDVGGAQDIAQAATQHADHDITPAQVEEFLDFLRKNSLVVVDAQQHELHERMRAKKPGWLAALAKSYLFIRVPLFKPDRFLDKTLPYVRWLGTKPAWAAFVLIAVVGVLMTVRQWDQFWATFLYFFNLQGAVAFAISMVLVKAVHELAHAYVAKAYGCRVPIIGVAFLVMWPVLYTDATDTWKLRERRHRLRVAAAGISAEMAVAAVALLAWNFAPEGVFKSVFFVMATSTWVLSVLINLNPLMRFDGYYLLSDWLKEPNMEIRAHALGKWWLRKALFDFSDPPPERPKARLIVYSLSIWIYRFLLFLGIALLVYHLFFKLLGIVLFLVEIVYFIVAPIWREMREWAKRKEQLSINAVTIRTMIGVAAVLVSFVVPWQTGIEVPAILKHRLITVYAPMAGKISELNVTAGEKIQSADSLVKVDAADVQFEYQQAVMKYEELWWQRASLGFDPDLLDRTLIVASELLTQAQKLVSLRDVQDRANVIAPIDATVSDMDPELTAGQWVGEGKALFTLKENSPVQVIAYVDEQMLSRLNIGQTGRFYPEGGGRETYQVRVMEIESFGLSELEELLPASLFGGGVAVRQNKNDQLIPVQATYRIFLALDKSDVDTERVLRGDVVLTAKAESFLERIFRTTLTAVFRESSF
ncbi:MAG: HlyD family efflux transporter periplasmic adaptor subunit [Magnetovibrio sp.]|nr:HlyD family efflux transporter periplasmic adaptor subunit [Magnetovibrio sp.]